MNRMKTVLLCAALAATGMSLTASAAEQDPYLQQHVMFNFLRAKGINGEVVLTFLRGKRYEERYKDLYKQVCIYRREVEFTRKDRDELFANLPCTPEDLLYKGEVERQGNSFRWVDKQVEEGKTYAYWVGIPGSQKTGAVGLTIREPWLWWPLDQVDAMIRELEKQYPDLVKVSVAGRTVRGREIPGLTIGNSDKRLALLGSVHASEAGPELVMYTIQRLLKEHRDLFIEVSIAAIPVVNVDERNAAIQGVPWYLRRNTISVDLNRNFPADWETPNFMYGSSTVDPDSGTYRGPSPASEPETRAVMSFLEAHPPKIVFSYHGTCGSVGRSLWGAKLAKEDQTYQDRCKAVYDLYAQGYENVDAPLDGKDTRNFNCTSGSLAAWIYERFNVPGFDVEQHKQGAEREAVTLFEVDQDELVDCQQRTYGAVLRVLESMR